jgi:microcystin-dependent protein
LANTTTANYGWQMPDPGGSANTWGNTLNATTQAIDQQVYTNAQAGVPVGTIVMFGGATPPANWLLCQGQSLATVGTYAALFAILQYAFGGSGANFNLPNLGAQFPIGAGTNLQGVGTGLGEVTGSFTTAIGVANLPPHAHPITDLAHNHGVNQWSHTHGDYGHGHGVNESPHTHGGVIRSGGPVQFVEGAGYGAASGTTTDAVATGLSIQAGYANLAAATSGISLNASGTGLSTTQNVGSGATFNVIPPFVCLNFIIKYA